MALDTITVNGVEILQPTSHGWQAPEPLGEGGAGNTVIPGIWGYRLSWNVMPAADFNVIWDLWFDNQGVDVTVELPEIGKATYETKSYTCRLNPITFSEFFVGSYRSVVTSLVGIDITA